MQIGKYTIPRFRLYPKLVEDTRKIYEKFSGEETEVEYVAHLLGQSVKSGSFLQKMADLRSYGLVEGKGTGKVKVSDMGKKLTYGLDTERMEALEKVIRTIPLWSILLDKFGVTLPTSKFWVDLAKITGLEAPDAQKMEDLVRKAYMDDVRYLRPVEKPVTSVSGEATGRSEGMEAQTREAVTLIGPTPGGIEELRLGDIRIWLPKAELKSAIRKAKKLLEIAEEEEPKEDKS